jgi:hypothetical protein
MRYPRDASEDDELNAGIRETFEKGPDVEHPAGASLA